MNCDLNAIGLRESCNRRLFEFQFQTLEDKLTKGLILTGEFIGDDDSGLEIDTEAIELEEMIIDTDKLHLNLKVFNSIFEWKLIF